MAFYQDSPITKTTNTIFDSVSAPGTAAPYAGIYRCTGCGHEIGIAQSHVLPSQNHAQHAPGTPIRWKLLVFAQHNT
jgi:hypothetical protein